MKMLALEKIEDLDLDLIGKVVQRGQIKYRTFEFIVSDLYLVPYVAEQINLYRGIYTELMSISEYLVGLTPSSKTDLISSEPSYKQGQIIEEYLQTNIKDFVQLWIYPNKEKVLDFITKRKKRLSKYDLTLKWCNASKLRPIRIGQESTSILQIVYSYLPNFCIEFDEEVHIYLQSRARYMRFCVYIEQSIAKVRFLNMPFPLDFYFNLSCSKLNLEEGYTDKLSDTMKYPSITTAFYMHSLSLKQYKGGCLALGGRIEEFTKEGYGDSDLKGLILGAINIRVKEDMYQCIKRVKSLKPKTIFSNLLLLGAKPISCKEIKEMPVCSFVQRNVKALLSYSSTQFIDNSTKVAFSMETYDFMVNKLGTNHVSFAGVDDNPAAFGGIALTLRNLIDILDKEVGEGNYVLEVYLLEDLIKKGVSTEEYRQYMGDCLTGISDVDESKARISFYTLD